MNNINRKIKILHMLIIANVVVGKVFFNDGSAATSATATSSIAAIIIAAVHFITFGGVFLVTKKRLIPKSGMIILPLIYYSWMLLWSGFSEIPLISLYYSASGLLMCVFAVYYIKLSSYLELEERVSNIMRLMLYIFVTYFLSSLFFESFYRSQGFMSGVPVGFSAVFYYFLVFFFSKNMIDNYKVRYVPIVVFLIFFGFFLKSFSAFLSYVICVFVYLIVKRKVVILIPIISMSSIFFIYTLNYLLSNEGGDALLFGKSVNSILTGSGRFQVYASAYDAFSNLSFIDKFKGVGFMAERAVLNHYDLAWSTDVHNSALLSALTGGWIGAAVYFGFTVYPFISKKIKKSHYYASYLSFHTMCVFFGFSSSYYLGRPSYLFLVSVLFYFSIINYKRSIK